VFEITMKKVITRCFYKITRLLSLQDVPGKSCKLLWSGCWK